MRSSLPAVVAGLALLLPAAGAAQVSMGVAASPGITFHAGPNAPRPQAAPVRDTSSGRHGDRGGVTGGDLFLADEHTYAPRYDRRVPARHHPRTPHIGVGPYFVAGAEPLAPVLTPYLPFAAGNADAGILRLRVAPASAQVSIDGFAFRDSGLGTRGSPDVGTGHFLLEAGVHRVELKAEGFQPAAFEVHIRPGETVTLSQQLTLHERMDQRIAPAASVAAPALPKALYVIPRCYAGDRKPDRAQLPAGCDPAAMRIIPAGR